MQRLKRTQLWKRTKITFSVGISITHARTHTTQPIKRVNVVARMLKINESYMNRFHSNMAYDLHGHIMKSVININDVAFLYTYLMAS
jgi:hypothetical protein